MRVCNADIKVRDKKGACTDDGGRRVQIDGETVLGSPFILRGGGTREDVCERHIKTIEATVAADGGPGGKRPGLALSVKDGTSELDGRFTTSESDVLRWFWLHELAGELRDGQDLQLVCHCAPKSCHYQ